MDPATTPSAPDTPSGVAGRIRTATSSRTDAGLILVVILLGVGAFAWAGFVANPASESPLVREPWPLFLWLCLLIITMQLAILRDPTLAGPADATRRRLVVTIFVTVLCIAGVVLVRLLAKPCPAGTTCPSPISKPIQDVLDAIGTWLKANRSRVFWLFDLALILFFWGSIWLARLVRRLRHVQDGQTSEGTLGEAVAGDFLVAIVFSLVVAPLFYAPLVNRVVAIFQAPVQARVSLGPPEGTLRNCELIWWPFLAEPGPHCNSISPVDVSTLFFFNLILLPLLFLLLATGTILILALQNAIATRSLLAFLRTMPQTFKRLRARLTLPSLFVQLRTLWPGFVAVAVISAGLASWMIQQYLVDLYDQWHGCNALPGHFQDCDLAGRINQNGQIFWLDTHWANYLFRLGVLAAVTVALLATIAAVSVQVAEQQDDARPFWRDSAVLRQVTFFGGLAIFSYWFFSAILSIANEVGLLVARTVFASDPASLKNWLYAPFIQPDPVALLSFAAFLYAFFRSSRRRRNMRRRRALPVHTDVSASG